MFELSDHGSICLLKPCDDAARVWVDDHARRKQRRADQADPYILRSHVLDPRVEGWLPKDLIVEVATAEILPQPHLS